MKVILGLNCFHADSSACLVVNNELVAAIEEERINRTKHWSGFPIESIKECLSIAKINSNQITDVAINTNPKSNILPKAIFFLKNFLKGKKKIEIIERYKKRISIKKKLTNLIKLEKNIKLHYINHHLAHLASSYYLSGLNKAIGLSIDGSGDFASLAIGYCYNEKIKIQKQIFFPNSLGIFYEAMTQFIGFKNFGDEYKVMGLAPYGKPIYLDIILKKIIIREGNFFKLNLDFFNHHKSDYTYKAEGSSSQKNIFSTKILHLFNQKNIDNMEFKKNFACSVQKAYEYIFKQIIEYIIKKNYSKNLIYSGGCALNSSANQYLINNIFFDKVFISHSPGDNGGAIGAALYVSNTYKKNTSFSKSPYLGTSYSNEEIELFLKNYKYKILYKFRKFEEINEIISDYLIEQKVIGWFQGGMEFGPRALGNRSILADPRSPNIKNIINSKIKKREDFRPFAPSILSEFKEEWYKGNNFENIYMSSVEVIRENKKHLAHGVTHVDGTGRVQSVIENLNPKFYNLIKTFYKKTNVPILLNTSFNENEPIVRTPNEAIECLLRTDIDALAIENYIVTKK
jgi:carbamoyltransferase